ncbi:MAG: hypothetical protein FWE13_02980 [Firmicutes bacterium]|nr:hypothetical protein [Bacillota bacterium]
MKNEIKYIRDEMLKNLKNNKEFENTVVAEIDGCNVAIADIALPATNNQNQVYRLIIIKHN